MPIWVTDRLRLVPLMPSPASGFKGCWTARPASGRLGEIAVAGPHRHVTVGHEVRHLDLVGHDPDQGAVTEIFREPLRAEGSVCRRRVQEFEHMRAAGAS